MFSTSLEPTPRETWQARRASLAVGVAPPAVLVALMAVMAGWIEPDTGLLCFVAGIAWTVFEMYRYVQCVDTALSAHDAPENGHDAL